MALHDVESNPIMQSSEEDIEILPSQRRRRNVQLVLLCAGGFVAAVYGVDVGAPMNMIRAATWASTVKLWSNSGTITNSGNGDGNVVGDHNNVGNTQYGDVTQDYSVHKTDDHSVDLGGGSVGGSINGDYNKDDHSITNKDVHGSMINNGNSQQKSCEGSGNDGSGAGAVGTVCCASLKGEVSCSSDHSGGKMSATGVMKAMTHLKNSDKVQKNEKMQKVFQDHCEKALTDAISDPDMLDAAITAVCSM